MSSHVTGGDGGGGDGGEQTMGQLAALHARISAVVPPCLWHLAQHGHTSSALPQSSDGNDGGGEDDGGGRKGGGIGGGIGGGDGGGGGQLSVIAVPSA